VLQTPDAEVYGKGLCSSMKTRRRRASCAHESFLLG
jgi:hypothetical protein